MKNNIIATITIIKGYHNWIKPRNDRPFPDPIKEEIHFYINEELRDQFLKQFSPGQRFRGRAITSVEIKEVS